MGLKIRKGFETTIKSFKLELVCECGGAMHYTTRSTGNSKESWTVQCEKCHKSSCVDIVFDNYGFIEVESC